MFIFSFKKKLKNKLGFTLVEMMVAVGLFTLIASFAIGAVLSIFDANRRAQSSKTVVDNLNLALENMSRTVRFGSSYFCGISANLSSVADCSGGGSALSVTFTDSLGTRRVVYSWNGGLNDPIRKSENGGVSWTNITAPEMKIQYLRFFVLGTNTADAEQPYVLAVVKGYVGNKPTSQSVFSIQTTMSQRIMDI